MSDTPLVDAESVRSRVDAALATHVEALRERLTAISPDAAPLGDAVEQMLSGGKRLRAAFCYWAWRAHGGEPDSPSAEMVVKVGAALELFQAAALFHDDVMDDSDTRRGLPAAHRVFAARHEAEGWAGGARRFGDSAAILLGDLALVLSEEAFAAAVATHGGSLAARAREVFDVMRAEVTIGQYLDVLAQALPWGEDPAADEARARDVVRAKSARYSVEHPLALGATLAGAAPRDVAALRAAGLPLGEAFQLRDDLLGVFGDPSATGKPAGDDLVEGKRTVLVARAVARARASGDDATAELVRAQLGRRDLDADAVRGLAAAIDATGAAKDVEALISELSDVAFGRLDALAVTDRGREMLVALGHAAVDRRF